MVFFDERVAQFWVCKPQTYGDWSDPTGGGIGRRYPYLLHHVLQTILHMQQCKSGVWNEIVMERFFDSFWKSRSHHDAQRLFKLGSGPLFLGRDLFPVWARDYLAVGAALLG